MTQYIRHVPMQPQMQAARDDGKVHLLSIRRDGVETLCGRGARESRFTNHMLPDTTNACDECRRLSA